MNLAHSIMVLVAAAFFAYGAFGISDEVESDWAETTWQVVALGALVICLGALANAFYDVWVLTS